MAIDKNYKETDLTIAKRIAEKYIKNPVIDTNGDGKITKKVTDILVLNKEHSVYINTPIESLQPYADKIKATITVVMKDGKVLEEKENVSEEKPEVSEEPKEEKPGKNKTKK